MRSFIASAVLTSAILAPALWGGSSLQANQPASELKRAAEYQNLVLRMSPTDRLIYEREAFRGQQRTERLEARNWLGISVARPYSGFTTGTFDLNSHLALPWFTSYEPADYYGYWK